MNKYFATLTVDDETLNEILQDLDKAKNIIYSCFDRLSEIGVTIKKETDHAEMGDVNKDGTILHVSAEDEKAMAEMANGTESPLEGTAPFWLETDKEKSRIILHGTEEGPLFMTRREALALAGILNEQSHRCNHGRRSGGWKAFPPV